MNSIEDLVVIKGQGTPLDKLVPVPSERLMMIRKNFIEVPSDYIRFLEAIGAGELGDAAYMLYDGLVQPEDVYGEAVDLDGVLLFGDDMQGFSSGFNTKDWSIVEIDPTNMQMMQIAPNFESFMKQKLGAIT